LKEYIDKYNTIIMICGGIFVIIVGIFIFFKNPVPQVRKNRTDKNELWQDFASMFGFTLANFAIVIPYILAFFTMFNIDLTYTDHSKPTPMEIVADETPQRGTAELNYIEDDDTSLYNLKEADGQTVAQEAEQIAAHEAEEIAKAGIELPKMLRNILILGGFLVGAMIWWVALTSLINLFRRNFRPRHLITINRIAGIIISALGTYTLLSVVINF
jgi:arginine exporter protein ArgO